MQDAKQALLVLRRAIAIADSQEYDEDVVRQMLENAEEELKSRAIAIADSQEYDEDVVRQMLENAEEELKDEGLRRDDTGELSKAA
jgi:histidinol dehydrogenase